MGKRSLSVRRFLALVTMTLMILTLTACEQADVESSSRGDTGSRSSGGGYFAHEISLDVDTSVPFQLDRQSVRAQEFGPDAITQNVLAPNGEEDIPLDPGPDDTLVAYAPLELENSPFRYVMNLEERHRPLSSGAPGAPGLSPGPFRNTIRLKTRFALPFSGRVEP